MTVAALGKRVDRLEHALGAEDICGWLDALTPEELAKAGRLVRGILGHGPDREALIAEYKELKRVAMERQAQNP